MSRKLLYMAAILASISPWNTQAPAQTPLSTAFTYQGRLKDGGSPASGLYDMHFRLYDAATGGTQLGPIICYNNLNVADGLFTATLDFGDQFAGQERFLDIAIRLDAGQNCADTSGFTTLSPRQKLTVAPNAAFALNADKLDGLDSTAFLQSIPVPLTLSGSGSSHVIRAENSSSSVGAAGIYGLVTDTASPNYGGRFESYSTSGRGVLGRASATSGNTVGGYFESDSTSGLGVFASASAASGAAYGLSARSNSTSGRGVYGWANAGSGTTYGGYFLTQSTGGVGAFGYATASSGGAIGIYGRTDGTSGAAVLGEATATSGGATGGRFIAAATFGEGVRGSATAASGTTYGGFFESSSTSGLGVYGVVSASTGNTRGVSGHSSSATGTGVWGWGSAFSGINYGVYGLSNSTSGTGVYGRAGASSGTTYGVYGQGDSVSGYAGYFVGAGADALYVENNANGRGVRVVATADTGLWASTTSGVAGVDGRNASFTGRGVYGYATSTTGTNYGVYGRTASNLGYGVYAVGDMGATGAKSFRIDHPNDPENKYLLHYSIESPEVLNAYSGKVTLDERGEAAVVLPAYFASINKDPRYTLTAVGAAMPNLHVGEEITEAALQAGEQARRGAAPPTCSFRIAGGVAGGKVSWRVEAVRNDVLVRTRGARVEVEKHGPERGKYQHPEHYGQPPKKGMDWHEDRETSPAVRSETTGE